MIGNLQLFNFNGHDVRTVDRDGEVWFVALDVARVLGFGDDTYKATRYLLSDEKYKFAPYFEGVKWSGKLRGKQEVMIISESGLYALLFHSGKPEAEKFRHWVTHEVLPSIRKTGSYELPSGGLMLPESPSVDVSSYEFKSLSEADPVPEIEKVHVRIGRKVSMYIPMDKHGLRFMKELCKIFKDM